VTKSGISASSANASSRSWLLGSLVLSVWNGIWCDAPTYLTRIPLAHEAWVIASCANRSPAGPTSSAFTA
jgi:hypothetical protein